MAATWQFLSMILVNWFIPSAIGLRCYVCDSGMEDCRNISSKSIVYLKDCGPKAICCATLTVENIGFSNPKGRWFQRICYFPTDGTAFDFGLNDNEMIPDQLNYQLNIEIANTYRSHQFLPPIANNLPKFSPLLWYDTNLIKIHSCLRTEIKDGCNDWKATPIFPLAEGYPMQEYRRFNKFYGNTSCYSCRKTEFDKTCHLYTKSIKVAAHYDPFGSGGCTILSIQMNNKSHIGNYVQRDLWHPGDSWCLNRGFESSPSGESVIGYFNSGIEGSCRAKIMSLALKQNNSALECSGKRVFYSMKELNEYKMCRRHVRERMGYELYSSVNDYMNPDELFANITEEEQSFKDEGQPYAIVYFKFCVGKSLCNFETESELVDELDNLILSKFFFTYFIFSCITILISATVALCIVWFLSQQVNKFRKISAEL